MTGSYLNVTKGRTTTGKTAGDVCVYGLQIILPLMNIDLLKIPGLCSQYYKVSYFQYILLNYRLKRCLILYNISK